MTIKVTSINKLWMFIYLNTNPNDAILFAAVQNANISIRYSRSICADERLSENINYANTPAMQTSSSSVKKMHRQHWMMIATQSHK